MRKFVDSYLIDRNFIFDSDQVMVTREVIKGSIVHCYETLDMIDQNLVNKGVPKMSRLVELANLSSIIGNLLGAGYADYSHTHILTWSQQMIDIRG